MLTLVLAAAEAAHEAAAGAAHEGGIVQQFGLEPKYVVMQVISFLIIFAVLYKFGIKPTVSAMEERNQKIADGLGGLPGDLTPADFFGWALGTLPDIDGDGRAELAVGMPGVIVDTGALRRSFPNYESLRMRITGCEVQAQGGAATAVCRREQEVRLKAGRSPAPTSQPVRFRLRRAGEGWLIEGIDAL